MERDVVFYSQGRLWKAVLVVAMREALHSRRATLADPTTRIPVSPFFSLPFFFRFVYVGYISRAKGGFREEEEVVVVVVIDIHYGIAL